MARATRWSSAPSRSGSGVVLFQHLGEQRDRVRPGESDQRINAGIPEIEAAMQANNKIFEKRIYPDADHAFNNDTGPRYNPEAAQDAWQRTLAWFGKYV